MAYRTSLGTVGAGGTVSWYDTPSKRAGTTVTRGGRTTTYDPQGFRTTRRTGAGGGGMIDPRTYKARRQRGRDVQQEQVSELLTGQGYTEVSPRNWQKVGAAGTTTAAGGYGAGTTGEQQALAGAVYEQRAGAEEQATADYEEAKSQVDAAYEAGLMSEQEYQDALTESREGIEAQYADVMRRTGEAGYGMAMGARRGAARELEMGRIGAIAGGARGIRARRAERRIGAGRERAAGYAQLYGMRQYPRLDIPSEFGAGAAYTGLTGRTYGAT